MPDIIIDGSDQARSLGGGFRIRVPDVVGTVSATEGGEERTRSFFEEPLDRLLEDAGLTRAKVVRIEPTGVAAEGTRAFDEPERTVSLDVPRTAGTASLVLLEDRETGAVSWHLPVDGAIASNVVATRGMKRRASGAKRGMKTARGGRAAVEHFEIPLPAPSATNAENARGFPSIKGAIIKVFSYPVAKIVRGFVPKWEAANRPYLVRAFGPEDYTDARKDFPALDAAAWQRIAGGRALLFVHGTFSTAAAGFGGLSLPVMQSLSQAYGGRTFAFNHFTLSDDPAVNARKFLDTIPAGTTLDIDIVCHSRGGLVSREIAAQGAQRGVTVRRIVFGAAVNNGTELANADHMVEFLDRYTTIAKLIPGPAQLVVDAVVTALQVLAKSLSSELEGLSAMDPRGPYLTKTNVPGSGVEVEGYAIASNFEPPAGTGWFKVTRVKDLSADRVFGGSMNDLVVPYEGVYSTVKAAGFPIPNARCLFFGDKSSGGNDGVIHTEVFKEKRTHDMLLQWLGATPTTAARARAADTGTDLMHTAEFAVAMASTTSAAAASRGGLDLTVEDIESMRPHIINLSDGKFKRGGKYSTSPADVDEIFATHLPRWTAAGGGGAGKPLRIMFWAHGGLISEEKGLAIAKKHIDWWKANGIYPIYFVWETGLFDALRVILEGVRNRTAGEGARGMVDDFTDRLVEKGVRALGGPKVWGAMKTNAGRCNAQSGGAAYVANCLKQFAAANPKVELHAAGHSAGSIFHSFFLPAVQRVGVPQFASLQLLAPAIRMDEFKARLMPIVGPKGAVRTARMFTMHDKEEQTDQCIGIYRKSLLYLIHHALEPRKETPLLGLEMSVMEDPEVRRFFTPASGGPASAVWSVTAPPATTPASSESTSHGGFDDDIETMSSVAALVLGASKPVVPYPGSRAMDSDWPEATEWLRGYERRGNGAAPAMSMAGNGAASVAGASATSTMATTGTTATGATATSAAASSPKAASSVNPPRPSIVTAGFRRKALCIGIDAYRGHELSGCVNDATNWSKTFQGLGFDVALLRDGDASIEGILQSVRKLVSEARSGDVLAIQYAGHGYRLRDLDQDEDDGDGFDEALVPFDFDRGAFILDDDIRREFSAIKPGVNLTCFLDCCHSGTATRVFSTTNAMDPDLRDIRASGTPRFLKTDRLEREALEEAHEAFRSDLARGRALSRPTAFSRENMLWVNFSACKSEEEALEHAGAGDFTTRALAVLGEKRRAVTNDEFQRLVLDRFGARRAQTPVLDCREVDGSALLLGGIGALS
jgi:hypothetical protein